jgi:quinoprotein glucose dehydrogenase
MPPFDHLSEVERRGVLRYLEAPEDIELNDTQTTDLRYAHGGYVWVRDHEGLPGNTPPWGTLNSIDLASGDIVWQVPFGNYPEHEELGFGAENYGGPIVTATGLIFIGATPDRKFRAYGTDNGAMLWETELPAAAYTTPVTYSVDGVQYVAISAGGGKGSGRSGSEYLAYRLPSP